jgi:Tol biopolymer transport system component
MSRRPRIALTAICVTSAAVLLVAGSAGAAFPGANGRIAFTHDPGTSGSDGDIFAIDPTGQNLTPLTSGPDYDLAPSYSADGEWIAFQREPVGSSDAQIWVMKPDGSGQTQVTSGASNRDRHPTFSPDGERIAFERQVPGSAPQIWIMNSDGSGQTQLTFPGPNLDSASDPSFSPDGQMIAFSHFDGATTFRGISVIRPDGTGQTPLTSGSSSSNDFEPNFSPDGGRIAFRRNMDIFTMGATGSGQSPLTTGGTDAQPVFSPDGTRVALYREDPGGTVSNLFLADSTGLDQNVTPLTFDAAPVFNFDPTWQPLNPPSCELTGKPTSKSFKQVSVTVTCTNENVTVVAEGSGKAPKVAKGAVASKAKKFTIPPVTAQIPQGTPTNVTLKIPKKGKKALKKAAKAGKKGKATITATLTDDLGQSSTDTFGVKFKPKKKK